MTGIWKRVRNKLADEIVSLVVGALVGTLGPYLASHIPKLGPYLSTRVLVPIWILVAIGIVGTLLIISVIRVVRRARNAELRTSAAAKPSPRLYPFSGFHFNWEIKETFLETCREFDHPSYLTLDGLIKGPLCPNCARALTRVAKSARMNGSQSFEIENPCPGCGWTHPDQVDGSSTDPLKLEVYKEVQRLARKGQFPSQG